VRYADDIVLGFQHEDDARRFLNAMRERLREFSLALHPDKTRLITFGRYAAAQRIERGLGKPETFNFLGFTFICGKSRQGKFLLHRKSRSDRIQAKLKDVKEELRKRRHQPIPEQGKWLRQVVGGFFAYHAVPTNSHALTAFHHHVTDLWRRSLRRRSQKDRTTWERMARLAQAFLPQPRILHPWPKRSLRRQTPKVGAECLREARSDLCGGHRVTCVSTAIFPFEPCPWKVVGLLLFCSGPPRGARAKGSGDGDDFCQPVHLEIAFGSPSGRGRMPEPCSNQHQSRVAVGEGAYHARSSSDLSRQAL